MNHRKEMALNFKMENFLSRKVHEHPEIIQLEKWVRYESMPRKKYAVARRQSKRNILS